MKKFVVPTIITILLTVLCIFFVCPRQVRQTISQLAEASFIYQIPEYQIPQITISSPISGSKFNIRDEVKIEFSVTDPSVTLIASLDGQPVSNGDIIKAKDLAIGSHTIAVKFLSSNMFISSDKVSELKEIIFTVTPLVGVKDLIGENGELVNFIIEGLGVENIYDKNMGLIYHDKVNDTEIGLNSEDGSIDIGDYDEDNLPELRVNFNEAWLKDIFNTNPYAEFTLRLELNDGTILNIPSADWEPQDPLQLLVVGLKDGVAAISGIDVTGDATGEVSIRLRDELGEVITAEPLGVATNSNGDIWVSFSDKRLRMYNSFGEFQSIDGTNPYWTASNKPDGLHYDGANLWYSSSDTNQIHRINSITGMDEPIGVVSRRLSIDGVTPDPGTLYTTQEYTSYNPMGISATYLCSSNEVSKRDTSIGVNFIETLPVNSPIWTNEQIPPSPSTGIVEVPDTSIPGDNVVYLSSTDGNIYKLRFVDKKTVDFTPTTLGIQRNVPKSGTEPEPVYSGSVAICGREQNVSDDYITTITWRQYFKVIPPPIFIEGFIVLNETYAKWQERWNGFQWVREFNSYPLASAIFSICTFDESWTPEQKFNDPILSTQLFTYPYDGPGINPNSEVGTKIRVIDASDIIPTTTFYYTGRYGNEGQNFGVGPAPVPSPIPVGYIRGVANESAPYQNRWNFLTDEGSLEILDQFTTSISVPQGLAMGKLETKVDIDTDIDNDGDIDEQDEPEEETPGGFVCINEDDDNNNGKQDKLESATVTGEDGLKEIVINVNADITQGKIKVSRDNRNITVWKAKDKGQNNRFLFNAGSQGQGGPLEKEWDLGDPTQREEFYTKVNNKSFWVEGYNSGTAVLTLSYTPANSEVVKVKDDIKFSVVKAEFLKKGTTQSISEIHVGTDSDATTTYAGEESQFDIKVTPGNLTVYFSLESNSTQADISPNSGSGTTTITVKGHTGDGTNDAQLLIKLRTSDTDNKACAVLPIRIHRPDKVILRSPSVSNPLPIEPRNGIPQVGIKLTYFFDVKDKQNRIVDITGYRVWEKLRIVESRDGLGSYFLARGGVPINPMPFETLTEDENLAPRIDHIEDILELSVDEGTPFNDGSDPNNIQGLGTDNNVTVQNSIYVLGLYVKDSTYKTKMVITFTNGFASGGFQTRTLLDDSRQVTEDDFNQPQL